ncbi:MAG: 4Fe-4S dicluster domain-containing protein [Cellulosilyticum sp.]|nr:4Fe-4S dicluster domain-containing protein [Cellulosilyticum sp.]
MSILIQKSNCVGCGRCIEVCPGNLIKKDEEDKAYIRHFKDCWGCTSCLKECKVDAISFYLGADIGGKGSTMTVSEKEDICTWQIKDVNGNVQVIEVNKKESNKY